ncbi:hypothetical protein [Leucobacter sp. GX24907]
MDIVKQFSSRGVSSRPIEDDLDAPIFRIQRRSTQGLDISDRIAYFRKALSALSEHRPLVKAYCPQQAESHYEEVNDRRPQ